MVEFTAVSSSNLQGVAYDAELQKLYIEFKGGSRYTYSDVPEEIYDGLMASASKGSFFADNIKDAYSYVRG